MRARTVTSVKLPSRPITQREECQLGGGDGEVQRVVVGMNSWEFEEAWKVIQLQESINCFIEGAERERRGRTKVPYDSLHIRRGEDHTCIIHFWRFLHIPKEESGLNKYTGKNALSSFQLPKGSLLLSVLVISHKKERVWGGGEEDGKPSSLE